MSFSFTNVTTNVNGTTGLDIVTDYAKITDEPNIAELSNTTAALDQAEVITYQCKKIDVVNTRNDIQYPAPNKKGVYYGVKLDEVYRINAGTTESPVYIDLPIVMQLTIRHPLNAGMTNSVIAQVLSRLVASLYNETSTKWRFEDLMRSALVPTQD